MGDFLPGDRSGWSIGRWWQVSFALIVTVALTVGGLHWLSDRDRPGAGAGSVSLAQGFADAALAAFSGSTTVTATDSAMTAGQRSAGLPADPVAGLTSNTAAGSVQVVLPGGLGAAQHTSGGQVVYPDTGAGFDMLAENTATGTRTVARINTAGGVRMVTTFVRTPADTVMLAHTNGYLTINRATTTAETVGMFAPAETRDATGKLVPSSYVVKKVAPQLYVLAEVIDPRPETVWPVFVDPPLHVGGLGGAPLPTGLFDSITSTISSAASAVGDAVTTAASATVAGAQTVGRVVKAHPLESAMLVGGVAMALTGVGGPAGAAMIASAGVNIASAGVDFAAALNPDNQALGVVSNVLGVASMVTPQGAAKAAVKEVAEKATEELATHADDLANTAKKVIDTATEAPTPPTQLANDIAGAPAAAKPPLPGVDTPKMPNAPPAKTSDLPIATSPKAGGPCECNAITPEPKGGVYVIYNAKGEPKYVGQSIHIDERLNQHISDSLKPTTKPGAARYDPAAGDRAYVLHRTDDPDALNGLEQHEIDRHNTYTTKTNPNPKYNGVGLNKQKVYRDTHRNAGVYDAARDAHLQQYQRPSSPADQRQIQQASTRQSTNLQRQDAQRSAREANQTGSRSSSSASNNGSSHKSSDNKKKKPKRKKSSQNHPKPKG
ncbi:GIY-YIG nuclease family protein [Mycolicibacterium sp. Y3]